MNTTTVMRSDSQKLVDDERAASGQATDLLWCTERRAGDVADG